MQWLEQRWYAGQPPLLLRPLASLYGLVSRQRREAFQSGRKSVWRAPAPVIVVGNISIGGTGKTPLTQSLCHWLKAQGWRPGIVSRGYGGKATCYPLCVDAETDPAEAGDEPALLALTTGCPLVVDPDRPRAVEALLNRYNCDLVISDDGLQHYRLARDIEIAVVDGERGLGNRALLPAGPLRESPDRLTEVDLVVTNGGDWYWPEAERMQLLSESLRDLQGELALLDPGPVHAVAGIGHPERFFNTLRQLGFAPIPHPFPDHHRFSASDLAFADELPVVMTAKDAVKCRALASPNRYYLPVSAELPASFFNRLAALLKPLRSSKGC